MAKIYIGKMVFKFYALSKLCLNEASVEGNLESPSLTSNTVLTREGNKCRKDRSLLSTVLVKGWWIESITALICRDSIV